MSASITIAEIIAYAANELTGDRAAAVERHLVDHPEDARLVARYRQVAHIVRTDDSVSAPAETVASAKAIFKPRRLERSETWIDRAQAVVARLIFDSRLQPAAVRSVSAAQRFQLSFETDGIEIDLQAERISGDAESPRWRLVGQVAAEPETGDVAVEMIPTGAAAAVITAEADERSVFIVDVEPGVYDIRIRVADGIVVLPGVAIK